MVSRFRLSFVFLTFLLFSSLELFAAAEPDSLLEVIRSRSYPSRKLTTELLRVIAEEGYADSTEWADDRSQKQLLLSTWSAMAFRSFDKGYFSQATERVQEAKQLARELDDDEAYKECLSLEGVCLARLGKYEEAIQCFMENIEQDEKAEDFSALSSDFNNLAAIYLSADRLEEAHTFILQAIDYEERVPESPALPIRYGIASEIDVKMGNLKEALEMIEEACALDSLQGKTLRFGRRLSQKGDVLMASEKLQEAESMYLRADTILREHNEPNSISINLKQLGTLSDKLNKKDLALSYWTEGLAFARQTGNVHLQQQFCEKLYLFYKGSDDASALAWLEQASMLKDSLNTTRNELMMDESSARYQTAQNSAIIAQQRHQIKRREAWLIGTSTLAVGMGACMVMLYFFRKKERELQKTKEELGILQKAMNSTSSPFITRFTDYVAQHMSEKTITNQQLCEELGMSQSSLNRQIHTETGYSVQNFIMKLRMEKAARLLASTEKSINSIANACGFDNLSYFTRVFKQATGVTPTRYRRQRYNDQIPV